MSSHTQTLARFLLNQWRNTCSIAERLYEAPLSDKKLRAARQALSRLREAVKQEKWPLEVPAGKTLVLDERWERKADGNGSEKCFRLRIQDLPRATTGDGEAGPSYVQFWVPPASWSGWIVPGFATMERDRLLSHKHLYTAARGPDNWLSVTATPLYREVNACAREAIRGELYGSTGSGWAGQGDLVYLGLGVGSGLADAGVIRELLEENRNRCVRAVPLDFSPVLLSEAVANLYQEFPEELAAGRLTVHPILGDLEQPESWASLMPPIEQEASLVVGMFGNTIGHLQFRERQVLQRVFDALDGWARSHRQPAWSPENSRMLLGVSLQRKDGAPHGRELSSTMRWLNFIGDPLRDLLETSEGEYLLVPVPVEERAVVEGRTGIAWLHRRGPDGEPDRSRLGTFYHEELPYKPSDGITGVLQRYCFAFETDLSLSAEEVFTRHHLHKGLWQHLGDLQARFEAGLDEVVLCEVTQFNLKTFRPALRRLGLVHGDEQVYRARVGATEPYAVLAFARA